MVGAQTGSGNGLVGSSGTDGQDTIYDSFLQIHSDPIRPFLAGAVVLAVAMGIGRFAYTPLLVIMRADAGLSVAFAGVLASANLVGYLGGALLAMHPHAHAQRLMLVRTGSVVVVLSTAMMALPSDVWLPARFITGLASGVVFVTVAGLLLDLVAEVESRHGTAVLFAGVGSGIAVAGVLVPAFARLGGSRAAWLGLATVGAIALAAVLPALPAVRETTSTAGARSDTRGLYPWLAVVYGVEGAAYIIPATFLVAMVSETHAIARYAAASWILVGITAIPSTAVWGAAARRWGTAWAFSLAAALQAITLLVPAAVGGPGSVLVVGVGLGATFMGMSSLGTALARDLRPANGNAAIGLLTVLYGIGQILGPLTATRVALATGSYRGALPLAGTALLAVAIAFAVRLSREPSTAT